MLELTVAFVIACAVLSIGIAVHLMALGPTHADRIVALEILLAGALALAIGASLVTDRTVFLDVGIGLALVGFVATIGWARLLERSLAESGPRRPE
jgi:multicomponent Na+:H+ antiporter subunit F